MSIFSADDHRYMAKAIQLAKVGAWTTMPNPKVGCVIVRNGEIVGEGWHEWAGEAHAEIHGLNQAREQAKGATVYVSLEPCSHYGRTPPCAEALIKAGVAKVICSTKDPNPAVAGKGLSMLENAGVAVSCGLLAMEALSLNEGFVKRMKTGRPWVKAKLGMSMDGRTAMASGESRWITCSDARSDVQRLRAASCAIISGVGSIIEDDSSLTVREQELRLPNSKLISKKQPLRVVVDSKLRTPASAKVITSNGRCLIVATERADISNKQTLLASGAEVLIQENNTGQVCLKLLLEELGQRGCNEVLVEAGATLAGAMLQECLLDEIILYMAPVLLGSSAKPLFDLSLATISDKQALVIADIRSVGQDWRITARPIYK
ncbi:MAG: bifunctional diaminohydroxyphosphoribosylaminopyrimidine deaminase/5-amino-6-(5-phosphoribosylamino)uracil reductase RibD [Candidatus Endonucleobacter bathymodioli]|uniref:Riboflavin biosynthesis protein RibD n=1 Tax=Candidatus Endonucleibacter bathymodioli TaxID=539814 RepID=A0AA90NMD8_9GAMM|nr:bifunctional diaminohydroxyphosphoribosylaminopyrimidine deaminase/5-amino-6-(5-phosphoribosylamino)uracil reductase RibD [Candidatus Endonucleobacter bathymodioli]